ncbi:MAG: four helix bundle protein [Pyrinomonadaceae bacterium]
MSGIPAKGKEQSAAPVDESRRLKPANQRPHFRFEDLEIWQLARVLAVKFHKLADELDKRRLYRYAEQLRAAGLSLTNNIAEGSGSTHTLEFKQYLNISRRSLFEDSSMLMVFESLGLLSPEDTKALLIDCDILSRKITNFSRSLRT